MLEEIRFFYSCLIIQVIHIFFLYYKLSFTKFNSITYRHFSTLNIFFEKLPFNSSPTFFNSIQHRRFSIQFTIDVFQFNSSSTFLNSIYRHFSILKIFLYNSFGLEDTFSKDNPHLRPSILENTALCIKKK